MKKIIIRAGTLVILSGLPGSGKSFLRTRSVGLPQSAWVSSDDLRDQILGTIQDLGEHGKRHTLRYESANNSVFEIMRMTVRERLLAGLSTVVDATNVNDTERKTWADIAEEFGAPVKVLIIDTPLEQCLANNLNRASHVPERVIREMHTPSTPVVPESALKRVKPGKEVAVTLPQGFTRLSQYDFQLVDATDTMLVFTPNELDDLQYDVVGDVHGLLPELLELLDKAGWVYREGRLSHPQGRKLLFLGDLVDRGVYSLEVLELVKRAVEDDVALALRGNHEHKLAKFYDTARREGIERWGSYANAETGMKLLKMKREQADALVDFIRRMPTHFTWEADKLAFVHGDVHRFDPMASIADTLMYGQSGRRKMDSDAEYEKRYEMGLNEYTLFRGHIPQTSAQPHIFSLERHPFQRGELVLMRLDDFVSHRDAGKTPQQAFEASILTQQCEFDFEQYSKKFDLIKGLEALVTNKLATRQLDDSRLFRVYKYSKATFWNNSWGESAWLVKARGIVLDAGGNIVSHPFDKCFNYGENDTGRNLADTLPVIEVEKLNGFLGIVSAHPHKPGELLLHTQGGFGGPFVEYIREYAYAPKTRGLISKFLAANDVTLMFEVLHPADPHIIEYPAEMMGLHLLGIRGKGQADQPWTEEAVDRAAAEMELRRPAWRRTTFGEVRRAVREAKTEGVMVRADDAVQTTLLKWKTPYYLTTKFLGRLSKTKIAHMFGNPNDFKKTIDEEFYPIVDQLVQRTDRPTLEAMSDENRVKLVRSLIDELQ